MAYLFRMKNSVYSRYAYANISTLGNKYITYTVQASNTTGFASTGDWVTNSNPTTPIGNGVSAAVKIYNPFTGSFLGTTEQKVPVSGATNVYDAIAGVVSFTTSDTACRFVFKPSGAGYQIFLDNPSITNKAELELRLTLDLNSKNPGLLLPGVAIQFAGR